MHKFYNIARRLSYKSVFRKKNKRMASIVVRGGTIISAATNSLLNHCEERALRPHIDCSGATIYIARRNGLISKPCAYCMDIIIKSGVRDIVYVDINGNLFKEELRA